MAVDPANASELAEIASELGADVLCGALRYPSDTGGWQLGDLDLSDRRTEIAALDEKVAQARRVKQGMMRDRTVKEYA